MRDRKRRTFSPFLLAVLLLLAFVLAAYHFVIRPTMDALGLSMLPTLPSATLLTLPVGIVAMREGLWVAKFSRRYLIYFLRREEGLEGYRPNLPPECGPLPVGTWLRVNDWLPAGQVMDSRICHYRPDPDSDYDKDGLYIGQFVCDCYLVRLNSGVEVLCPVADVMVLGFDGFPLPDNWQSFPDLPDPTPAHLITGKAVRTTGRWAS